MMRVDLMSDQAAFLAHEAARAVQPELPSWRADPHAQTQSMLLVQSYQVGATVQSNYYTEVALAVMQNVFQASLQRTYVEPAIQVAGVQAIESANELKG